MNVAVGKMAKKRSFLLFITVHKAQMVKKSFLELQHVVS